ncbi:MAG: hypothetical protein AABW58_02270 [Nanoarchaeota archaeon]
MKSIDEIFGEGTLDKLRKNKLDPKVLEEIKKLNNPNNEPTGHFTGRCMRCYSNDLWDDATAYGCNFCDALYLTGHLYPQIIPNKPEN